VNPNPFKDVRQWYGKWSSGDLPRYMDRRTYKTEMYYQLIKTLGETDQSELFNISVKLIGWEIIERSLKEIKVKLKQAVSEEQFQSIGLYCRETIISLHKKFIKVRSTHHWMVYP
jgi:hypothetical protein